MAKENKRTPEKQKSPFSVVLRTLMSRKPATTQEKIAEITGKTRQTVSQYVNGISEPGYDTLIKIADYFNVSIDYLLGRTKDPAPIRSSADDLGLSPDAIKWLIEVKERLSSDELSRLIENAHFQKLVYNILDHALLEEAEIVVNEVISNRVKSLLETTKTRKKYIDLYDKEYNRFMNESTGRIKDALRAVQNHENAFAETGDSAGFGVLYDTELNGCVLLSDIAKLRINSHLELLLLSMYGVTLKKYDLESRPSVQILAEASDNYRRILRNLA